MKLTLILSSMNWRIWITGFLILSLHPIVVVVKIGVIEVVVWTRPLRPTMRPHDWWNDGMIDMLWLASSICWKSSIFIDFHEYSTDRLTNWQTDPLVEMQGSILKIFSGLSITFVSFQWLKKIDFPHFFLQKSHRQTDKQTDWRTDPLIEMWGRI